MSYNLLNFPTNGIVDRDDTLRKIVQYEQPDVLLVCELNSLGGANDILNNSLNVYGTTKYQRANYVSNQSSSNNLQNMAFYNSEKLTLYSQDVLTTTARDISEYIFYYNSPYLAQHNDTIFIDFYVAHLKASQGGSNAVQRYQEVKVFTDYIDTKPTDRNRIFCGDLNLYNSSETAYQELINAGTYKMVDPINQPGTWHNNSSFTSIHTQSTRLANIGDSGSSGGLDDRFDFILISENIDNVVDSVSYINNTYKVIGNDGNHFNQSLLNGTNTSVPDSVLYALYYMSDHLPIRLKLKIEAGVAQVTPPVVNNGNTACSGSHPLISQVVESGNNKAVELYNPSNTTIDLTNYKLERYSNGNYPNSPTTYTFTGFTSFSSDDVFVIANSSSDASILAVADVTNSIAGHNGNDAYVLKLISDNSIIDSFGDADNSANNAQQDASLTRSITTVNCPYDTNPIDNFDANDYVATAYNGGSISGYDLGGKVSLPVTLHAFSARLENQNIILTWQTASETNNAYFNIQRSSDGKNFETIDRVEGAGTTYELQEYVFIDESPVNGLNYYRLQQVDFDGQSENHRVISVLMTDESNDVTIVPNQVRNQFDIVFNEAITSDAQIDIYTINGQLVKSESTHITGNRQTIDASQLNSGMYIIRMNVDNRLIMKRFVKM
jgi:endonuclease/exonuclease/phosphatase family metal-dependent hydrolase